MNKTILSVLSLLFCAAAGFFAAAQEYNPIPVALPSLQIAPDARGGGMGDTGAATAPDVYSQHWNAAKYPFIPGEAGIAFTYTPWLGKLVDDIHLLYTSGYLKFGYDGQNVLSASLRYFSLGDVEAGSLDGKFWQMMSPHELAVDAGYSRKLTETFSGAVTLRYIYADYSFGSADVTPGNAFAADIAGYNETSFYLGRSPAQFGFGFNLSNIGTKISYDGGNTSMFLPANLRLGVSLTYPPDPKNTFAVSFDINKLLVPTPQLPSDDETEEEMQQRIDKYERISSIGGIFKSFADAPGGTEEKMREIVWSLGAEYSYEKRFTLRTGYHHENEYKGNRRYFTFGAGFKSNIFQIDAACLVSAVPSNPLDQTLRISLGFDMEGIGNLFIR
ncbi:MAG: type IX secretion system outer membrane channel protein PorV [Proteiniphilum sp.]|jgi:hypothetical protein|nr:type IX secretion system outer membrane channel protein PorV [Proteiniphilum sp.]